MEFFKKSALVIDDDVMITKLYTFILKGLGFNTYQLNDGFSACRWIQNNLPDLILCDIMMPDMDGLEVFKYIRSLQHTKNIPIFAVTGLVMPGDKEVLLTHGFDAYIKKPVDIKKLTAAIKKVKSEMKESSEY
jgi:two-component system, OmpR family, alkaline phosphatase synthesis response regulator PhoP